MKFCNTDIACQDPTPYPMSNTTLHANTLRTEYLMWLICLIVVLVGVKLNIVFVKCVNVFDQGFKSKGIVILLFQQNG